MNKLSTQRFMSLFNEILTEQRGFKTADMFSPQEKGDCAIVVDLQNCRSNLKTFYCAMVIPLFLVSLLSSSIGI